MDRQLVDAGENLPRKGSMARKEPGTVNSRAMRNGGRIGICQRRARLLWSRVAPGDKMKRRKGTPGTEKTKRDDFLI